MDAKMVGQWLERVTVWTGSVTNSEEQSNNAGSIDLDELRAFLQELHDQLVECGRPTVALKKLPNVGQLLGKLCCNEVLMIQEADYQLVLQCVLALHTSQPCSPLEEKAVKWVESQVRHSVSFYKRSNPCSGIGESIGSSASQYNHIASLKLLESMVEDLNKVPLTRWDYVTNCLVPSAQLSSTTLRDLSELCIPLVTSGGDVAPLVECLLSCHGNDTEDGISPRFLQVVMATQDNAYTSQCCSLELSYEGRVSLWTRYLPALESEFLHLIEALVSLLQSLECGAKQLMSSRELPKACVENQSLLTSVDTLMELLFHHTQGSTYILTLIDLFNQCVKECQRSLVPYCRHHRRPGLESLHALLQAEPQELPLGVFTVHLNNISNCVTRTDPARRLQAWLLLVQSQAWYRAVMKMLLLGTADNAAACLNILAWYHIPLVPDRHQQYKAQVSDLVTSLRGLCSKSSLQTHDLHYAFSQGQALPDSHIHNVVRPLLMVFVVHGNGAHQIVPDIVRMASGGDQPSAVTTLVFLLDSIEFNLMSDIPRSFVERSQQTFGHTLHLCQKAYDEYQREQSAGTVNITDKQRQSLMRRYDRIHKLRC